MRIFFLDSRVQWDHWKGAARYFNKYWKIQSNTWLSWIVICLFKLAFLILFPFPFPLLYLQISFVIESLYLKDKFSRESVMRGIDTFIAYSTSVQKSPVNEEKAYKELKYMDIRLMDLLNNIFEANNTTYEEFVSKYEESFNKRKLEFANVCGKKLEQSNIHPTINNILRTIHAMIEEVDKKTADLYYFAYEKKLNELMPFGSNTQKSPSFSVHLKRLFNEENPNYFSCILPIECKQLDYAKNGIGQSLAYALENIKSQLEIGREIDGSYQSYSVASDGHCISLSLIKVEDRILKQFGQRTIHKSENLLLPKTLEEARNANLSQLPGFVALLAVLAFPTFSCPTKSLQLANNIKIESVLGMGGYSTVLLGRFSTDFLHTASVAIKLPRYSSCGPTSFEKFHQIDNEAQALRILSKVTCINIQKHLPHLKYYESSYPYLVLNEVGCPMQVFVGKYLRLKQDRIPYLRHLETTLLNVTGTVYDQTKLTHRDIRPDNIILIKTDHVGQQLFDLFKPVLIDWGYANTLQEKYSCKDSFTEFCHDDIVKEGRKGQSTLIKYEREYDVAAIQLTITAIAHNELNLQAPWKDISPLYFETRAQMTADRFTNLTKAEK